MSQYETIDWRDLPGNKYVKSVDAAMITEAGYVANQKVRHCHAPKAKLCNVTYDREYVIQFLIKRFIYSMSVAGIETIHELIDEAWNELHGLTGKDAVSFRTLS